MTVSNVPGAIVTICNGLTVVVNGVTLIVKAVDPPPAQLSTAKLPCVYTLAGEAEYDMTTYGADLFLETRKYRVQCAIEALEQTSRETRELWTRALIIALRDKLAQYPYLGTAGTLNAVLLGDSGATVIQDAQEYLGFELTLQVSELISRTYAAGE